MVPNSEVIYRKIFLVEGSDEDSVLWFADEQATLRLVEEFVLKKSLNQKKNTGIDEFEQKFHIPSIKCNSPFGNVPFSCYF